MATVKIILDKRTVRKDGTSPLKLSISHKKKTTLVSLNVFILPELWDASASLVTGGKRETALNAFLFQKKLSAENALLELSRNGELDAMDLQQVKAAALGKRIGEEPKSRKGSFSAVFREFTDQKANPRTRELYERTLAKLYAFCPKLDKLEYEEITRGWLTSFDAFMARTAPARNARNIHLRNIRSVFNYAIDEEHTTFYPFRRFKIKAEETRKRSLTVKQLRTLAEYPCEEYQRKYRDLFLLMFFLIGINPIDLFNAKKSDIVSGRLEYRRAKTGKLYSVKVEPEAWDIINRHAGKGEHLLDVLECYKDYHDFTAHLNRELKKIGAMTRKGRGGRKVIEPLFPDLSAYWARHSWATIAYLLDVPKETISEALGHEIGSRVTSIYIAFDRRKVDAANRRVIDWVLHGEK